MTLRSTLIPWILFLTASCAAQTPANQPPEPNGVVIGRVFCGDTGRPARFASVSLMPIPDPTAKLKKTSLKPNSKSATPTTSVITAVDTSLDGSYILTHVAPGAYYVIVKKDGYINPVAMFTKKQLEEPTNQERSLIEQALPKINVEQDSTAHADVQLQRGAAVSGTISYDDGTPAGGMTIRILHKDENGKWVPLSGSGGGPRGGGVGTNDRGFYRIGSLLPDTYLLEAQLELGDQKTRITDDGTGHTNEWWMRSSRSSLTFYGEGTPFIDQAASFTLRGDDERNGQDLTIPISKLHKLTGRVAAGPTGHFVNAASLELITADKKPLAHANIDREDGLFHFEFVPEGDYTLRVTNARDVAWDPPDPPLPGDPGPPPGFPRPEKERILETYGNVDMPLILRGDMNGITATIPPKQNTSSASN